MNKNKVEDVAQYCCCVCNSMVTAAFTSETQTVQLTKIIGKWYMDVNVFCLARKLDINVESIAEPYLIIESSMWNQKVLINVQVLFYITADIHNTERVSYQK
jgi:hypothetical protein